MKKYICILLACVMVLSLAACGGNEGVSGKVATDGSTSMEKVIGALKETFESENAGVEVTYNPTGSGAGITAVAEGRCDIGLSSRNLKDSEKEQGLIGTVLAFDGIAIIVNPENTIENLSVEQIAAIYTGEITSWSEVGGIDSEIVLIGREAGSGTRGGFEEIVGVEDQCRYRQELTSTGDVIAAVSQNPGAIGYASLAAVKDSVKAICVNGVVPSDETVQNESYAIQRPFVLVTREDTPLSEAASEFFDFITSEAAREVITAAGVVPAN
nr:phosphate ABC transporter substrate-binding protein [Oscillospiraceae bacterium]